MLRLRTLGGLSLEQDGRPVTGAGGQGKPLALLALLAASSPDGVSRDKLLAYLWPESDQKNAAHGLRQLLYSLRRDLGEEALLLGSAELRLNPAAVSSDVGEFIEALEEGDLERAVSLHAGPFLDGFHAAGSPELQQWIERERDRRAKRCRDAVESLAVAAEGRGDHSAAVAWWCRLATTDPFNSHVTVRCMEALSAAGDLAGALKVGRAYQERVRKELDAEPDPAVGAVAERVRHQGAMAAAAKVDLPTTAPPLASIAVLPFVNMSADAEDEYFSDGLTDELTSALSRVEGLRVVARTSAFAFKGRADDVRQIGERLNVRALIEGSVRKDGGRVRIAAHLVNAAEGFQIWSGTYERPLADLIAVQQELSHAVVGALSTHLAALASPPRIQPGTRVLEAYTAYLKGRFFSNKRTIEGLRQAIDCFGMALHADPQFALAHAGVAEACAMLGFGIYSDLPPRETMPKARAAAEQALALDPDLAEAHVWLGVVAFLYDWDWDLAESELKRALALNPAYTPAHTWYAVFLTAMGRHHDGIRVATHARTLEPLSPVTNVNMGRCYYFARRFDDALRELRLALELEVRHEQTYWLAARALCAKGLIQEALTEIERGMGVLGRLPGLLSLHAYASARAGFPRVARQDIEELRRTGGPSHPLSGLAAHVALGDLQGAQLWIDRALDARSGFVPFLAVDPLYDPLRSEPWFGAILRKLRLEV